ncbi:MAG: aminotransferase class IV [Planctomycetes bacterium]|nr:aminotransferase class IV [Planctomycetota bacterium]
MTIDLAFLNGRFVPASEAVVPVYDTGFMLGATIAEQVRTFHGRLFRLDKHMQRLSHSLQIVDVDPGISLAELSDAARELAARNYASMDPRDDLGMSIFVTPGPYASMAQVARRDGHQGPMVCMHTFPLPFGLWAEKYQRGESLVVSRIRQVPPDCWPPELKCRSRMHYYLADLYARRVQPTARALLLDHEHHVLEASTANIIVFLRDEGIVSPPQEKILPGVSVGVVAELAERLGMEFRHRDLTLEELRQADEVMLCSTSPCVWPVTELDGHPVGGNRPGETCRRLLAAWSDLVGLDIPAQAIRFAQR